MIGPEIDEAETIFIPCRRIRLLTLSKRFVSLPDAKHQYFFVALQHFVRRRWSPAPSWFCMFLLMLRKRFDTTRIANRHNRRQYNQNDRQLPTVIEHHDEQTDDRCPFRTTVISAPEERSNLFRNRDAVTTAFPLTVCQRMKPAFPSGDQQATTHGHYHFPETQRYSSGDVAGDTTQHHQADHHQRHP